VTKPCAVPRFTASQRLRGLDDGGGGYGSAAACRNVPSPPSPHPPIPLPPLSSHPLPTPALHPHRHRRRRGGGVATGPRRARSCLAGLGRAGISATLHNVAAAASPSGVAAGPRLRPCRLCSPSPCRARRSRTSAAGGASGRRSAKLIKVYTWLAQWCAGGRKKILKVYLSVCQRREKVYVDVKKVYTRGYETRKKVYFIAKNVYIFAKKVYMIYQKMTKMFTISKDV
jgi:hypothetical protein